MMKNVLAVAMAATVAISVTGCKGKKNQDAASSAPSTSLSDSASTAQSETPDTAEKEDTSAAASESKAESEAESKPDSNAASTENKTAESEAASDKAEKPAASQNTNPDNVSTKDGPAKAPVYNTHKTTTGTKTPAQKPAAVTPAATPAEKKSQPVYTFTVRHHDATCTTQGYDEHICNEWGGMNYNDNYVAAKGHSWDNGTVTKAATYTETGIKTFTCTVCSATKTEDIVKVHTHDYTRLGEIIEGPYCVTEGKRWMYCSYEGCNERVLMPVPAIGYHDWDTEHTECLKKATCTEKGTMLMHCKRDASHTMTYDYGGTGHIWDEGVITTPPTYDEYGEKTLYCKNCNATKTENVLPTKYTFTVTVVPPTCTEDGYTMHKCNEDDSFSYKDNIVHSTGHHAAKRVIEPTCKEEGRTEIYCIVCGDVSSTFDFTPKKDHTWDNGVVTTEPTTEHEGVKTYTCTGCGETKTESIARLPASAKVAANPIVAGAEPVVEVPAQEMSAESINAETYVAETPVESAVPAETPAEPVAPVEPAIPAETPAEPAAPVESAETEKSAETSEDSTDTKQEDADMPKETEAEVVIVEGAAE